MSWLPNPFKGQIQFLRKTRRQVLHRRTGRTHPAGLVYKDTFLLSFSFLRRPLRSISGEALAALSAWQNHGGGRSVV